MSLWRLFTHDWSFEWSIWLPTALALVLYWRGYGQVSWAWSPASRRSHRWRAAAFVSGVALVVVALESPLDHFATTLFFIHMTQHLVLLVAAPPLIVAGSPWLPMWRGLPLRLRRAIAPPAAHLLGARPVERLGRFLRHPVTDLVLFATVIWFWHVPGPYDLTIQSPLVHDLEHLTFLGAGLLYWSQAMDSLPFRRRLPPLWMLGYLLAGAFQSWVLALLLAFASHPFYSAYFHVAGRPGGISALTDQQIGAGMMWVPASIPFAVLVDIIVYRWLVDDERRADDLVRRHRIPEEALPDR
ncbi:MAG TPA: cytochrome c oxidase assembly protein [Candidatus Micrarchaeia archaeon]|nr:cytochrome c oxidase assembly protein [Candidatus Micrarchaeia archaeon]